MEENKEVYSREAYEMAIKLNNKLHIHFNII